MRNGLCVEGAPCSGAAPVSRPRPRGQGCRLLPGVWEWDRGVPLCCPRWNSASHCSGEGTVVTGHTEGPPFSPPIFVITSAAQYLSPWGAGLLGSRPRAPPLLARPLRPPSLLFCALSLCDSLTLSSGLPALGGAGGKGEDTGAFIFISTQKLRFLCCGNRGRGRAVSGFSLRKECRQGSTCVSPWEQGGRACWERQLEPRAACRSDSVFL